MPDEPEIPEEPAEADPIAPSLTDVAALIHARTKDSFDNWKGTFTEDTQPTAVQAQALIDRSAKVVSLELGVPHSKMGSLLEQAKSVVAIRAAWQIEVSFFPNQVDSGDSAADHLRQMYEADVASLAAAARDNQAGGTRARTMRVGR